MSVDHRHTRCLHSSLVTVGAALLIAVAPLAAVADQDPWPSLAQEVFQGRLIAESDGAIQMFAPSQAEDAAVVPISIRIPATVEAAVKSVTLIVDRNPAPVAAVIKLGPAFAAGGRLGERKIETRIRVDSFSKVRAILETADGKLHMVSKFVAGAGGCSAPAAKDLDEAVASIGRMQIRLLQDPNRDADFREAIVSVRHPSFTGMQRDPKTNDFTPAWFVTSMDILHEGDVFMHVEGGISISENPHFRFNLSSRGNDSLEVRAVDTKGTQFSGQSEGS